MAERKKEKETKPIEPEQELQQPTKTENPEEAKEEKVFTYIGPSIDGFLMQNTTLKGTKEQIRNHFSALFKKHPKLDALFIPVEKLGETKIEGALKQYYDQTVRELYRR